MGHTSFWPMLTMQICFAGDKHQKEKAQKIYRRL